MSERHGGPGGRWGGGPPPWWPEGEPFPPSGGWYGSGRRHRAPRFFVLLPFIFLAVFIAFVATIAWLGATFGAGPVVGAIVVGAILLGSGARRFALPIGELLDAVERVAAGDYGVRVRVRGRSPRQVRRLASSFNTMVERLGAHDAQRRQLLADISHELRTPLTVMQGQLEGMLDRVYPLDDARLGSILEETRVMERVIEDLRTLSLAEAGALELHREATDLRALLDDTATSFRAQADAAGVALSVEVPAALEPVELDPVRMRQVLANLVANAVRYTPRGGTVTLAASADERGTRLEVRDTGAGIRPEALPHVFERFYRSADSRGSGLGLPIARSLVVAHGGEIAAHSDGADRGTTMRVTLPANASRAS